MLRLAALLGLGLTLVTPIVLKQPQAHCATCNPNGTCTACKNCKYCSHCSKGGKCSVCR